MSYLLIHSDGPNEGTSFVDSALQGNAPHTVTGGGDAQHDTSQAYADSSSILLDGAGDYLTIDDDPDWDWGASDFTIRFAFRQANDPGDFEELMVRYQYTGGLKQGFLIRLDSTRHLNILFSNDGSSWAINASSTEQFASGAWHYISIVRTGDVITAYEDATQLTMSGSAFTGSIFATDIPIRIGCEDLSTDQHWFDGHLDEIEILLESAIPGFDKVITEAVGMTDVITDELFVETLTETVGMADVIADIWPVRSISLTEDLGMADVLAVESIQLISLTEDLGMADVLVVEATYLKLLTEAIELNDTNDAFNWTQWFDANRERAVVRYILTLTGHEGGPDIEIPIRSFQGRITHPPGHIFNTLYLSVVVPGIVFNGIDYAAEINARSDGDLQLDMIFVIDGVEELRERIIEVDLDTIRIDEGGTNKSITLLGFRSLARGTNNIIIVDSSYYSLSDGKIRYRFIDVDPYLRVGDVVQIRTDEFIVGEIVYFVDVSRQQMEVSEL